MIACAIGMTGPPPSPGRMRIATRNSRDGAIPERNELTVNRTVQIRKNRRRPNRAREPAGRWDHDRVYVRNEVMTHDISKRPADSEPCMWGRATLVTLKSRTCMTVTIITENVMAIRGGRHTSALRDRLDGAHKHTLRQNGTTDESHELPALGPALAVL